VGKQCLTWFPSFHFRGVEVNPSFAVSSWGSTTPGGNPCTAGPCCRWCSAHSPPSRARPRWARSLAFQGAADASGGGHAPRGAARSGTRGGGRAADGAGVGGQGRVYAEGERGADFLGPRRRGVAALNPRREHRRPQRPSEQTSTADNMGRIRSGHCDPASSVGRRREGSPAPLFFFFAPRTRRRTRSC
jgi:hypothetical protein